MKKIFYILVSFLFLLACQQNEEPVILQETGVVVNYDGAEYCSIVIELDNGTRIQPLRYPEDFVFVQGQRLLVSYTVLPNILSTCGKGAVSELLNVEELECGAPLTDPTSEAYGIFPGDPVILHEVSINAECLHLKVTYSGGCRNHEFYLIHTSTAEQSKKTAVLELVHDANNDVCEAAFSKDLQFNLAPLTQNGFENVVINTLSHDGETHSVETELIP